MVAKQMAARLIWRPFVLSGRRDLNPGSLVPQTSALTKLGHVPSSSRTLKMIAHTGRTRAVGSQQRAHSVEKVRLTALSAQPANRSGRSFARGAVGGQPHRRGAACVRDETIRPDSPAAGA